MSPERVDPGRTDWTTKTTPKVVGGLTPACTDRRGRRLPLGDRHGARGLRARVGRADEAAREHLPLGQHRARERARAALRPDGHRRLGSGRRGGDEAVRLPVVPAGAGARRPLHTDRPVLPVLEGPRVRLLDPLHRPRRRGQQQHAVLLPLGHLAGDEPRRAALGLRIADPDPRRRLQGRYRRHARDARREARRSCSATRVRPSPTTIRTCPSSTACNRRRSSPRRTTASRS